MMKLVRMTVLVALVLLTVSLSGSAFAKEVAGRFGLGLDNTLTAATLGIGDINASPNSPNAPKIGLSFRYWITNDWGINAVVGFLYGSGTAAKEAYDDPDGIWAFTLDFKGIYNFHKGDKANMGLFATFHMRKESTTIYRPEGPNHSNFGVALAFGFTPEFFFTDNFAIAAELGFTFRFQEGFAVGISGDNLLGGLGIHYYF